MMCHVCGIKWGHKKDVSTPQGGQGAPWGHHGGDFEARVKAVKTPRPWADLSGVATKQPLAEVRVRMAQAQAGGFDFWVWIFRLP